MSVCQKSHRQKLLNTDQSYFILDSILNIINNCNIIKMIRSREKRFDNHKIIYVYFFIQQNTLFFSTCNGNHLKKYVLYLLYQIYFFKKKPEGYQSKKYEFIKNDHCIVYLYLRNKRIQTTY